MPEPEYVADNVAVQHCGLDDHSSCLGCPLLFPITATIATRGRGSRGTRVSWLRKAESVMAI